LAAGARRTLARERQAFQAELARFEERCRQNHQQALELAAREALLAGHQQSWEHEQLVVNDRMEQLRLEVQGLQAQRRLSENQLAAIRDEVERVARLLLEEAEPLPGPVVVQAA
jgi:hypothetical protein